MCISHRPFLTVISFRFRHCVQSSYSLRPVHSRHELLNADIVFAGTKGLPVHAARIDLIFKQRHNLQGLKTSKV